MNECCSGTYDNDICYLVEIEESSEYLAVSVFDKLIWHTIVPKSFLFGSVQLSLQSLGQKVQLIVINVLSLTSLTLC